ncbi:MAG TPA: LysR family transcriptional regulator [Desulfotomaculum sp.]|nr:LysR family transcriptional regulator [Desulfotomaculum sp.]
MNFKQLETFLRVVEWKSFTKAAQHLYLSQPTISLQIKALEEELQVILFQRNEKKVTLTEAGRLFYTEVKQILHHYYNIQAGLEDLKDLKTGRLMIGASTIPGEYLLPQVIGDFYYKYPGIKINLCISDSASIGAKVRYKELDLGIVGFPFTEGDIVCTPWTKDYLVLIVSSQHKWARLESIDLEELIKEPIILREPGSGTRQTIEMSLEKKGVSFKDLKVTIELGSTRAIITAVLANAGISIVSFFAAHGLVPLNKLCLISLKDVDFTRYLYIIRSKNWWENFAAKAFLSFLKTKNI